MEHSARRAARLNQQEISHLSMRKEIAFMFCREDKTLPPVPALLTPFAQHHVIVLDGEQETLDREQGGGLICLGTALQRYREHPLLAEILGPLHGFLTPPTELIVRRASADHYLTR